MRYANKVLGIVAVVLVPLLYGCAYLVLAERRYVNPGGVWVEYQVCGDVAGKLFVPANWLDRQVRPAYWHYPQDDVQYFPPGPEFPLSNEPDCSECVQGEAEARRE